MAPPKSPTRLHGTLHFTCKRICRICAMSTNGSYKPAKRGPSAPPSVSKPRQLKPNSVSKASRRRLFDRVKPKGMPCFDTCFRACKCSSCPLSAREGLLPQKTLLGDLDKDNENIFILNFALRYTVPPLGISNRWRSVETPDATHVESVAVQISHVQNGLPLASLSAFFRDLSAIFSGFALWVSPPAGSLSACPPVRDATGCTPSIGSCSCVSHRLWVDIMGSSTDIMRLLRLHFVTVNTIARIQCIWTWRSFLLLS